MGIRRLCMATKTITCPKCNQPVRPTLGGTQHRCICGSVIPYKSSPGQIGGSCGASEGRKGSAGATSAPQQLPPPSLEIVGPTPGCGGRGSSLRPNKRALLCGVSYKEQKYKLKGTHNDVINMKDLLVGNFGYSADCIRILSEDGDPRCQEPPTKKNIESCLKWLVDGCQSGDYLVFYFSGHGLRQPDFHEDEIDGFDETICPVDFVTEGMILDNDINKTIVWPLKEGVTLHAIVDACHSGTILDLEYVYNRKMKVWNSNIPPSGVRKSTSGGWAISLSACEDDKMAADTTAFSENKAMNGAMTYILTQSVKENTETTYGHLLDLMGNHIEKVNRDRWTNSRFVRAVFRHKIIQEPLLSSSKEFDVYNSKFIL